MVLCQIHTILLIYIEFIFHLPNTIYTQSDCMPRYPFLLHTQHFCYPKSQEGWFFRRVMFVAWCVVVCCGGVCSQDRQFVELEVPYNGQPTRPSSTPPHSPTPTLSLHETTGHLFRSCCGRRCGRKKYQVSPVTPTKVPANEYSINLLELLYLLAVHCSSVDPLCRVSD